MRDANTDRRRRHLARLRADLYAVPSVVDDAGGQEPWTLWLAFVLLLLALALLAGWWG